MVKEGKTSKKNGDREKACLKKNFRNQAGGENKIIYT